MTSLAAKIRKWLGLGKKPVDAPKARCRRAVRRSFSPDR